MIRYLQRLRKNKGFTLIELVVVIGIIAVLSGMIISSISDDSAKRNAAREQAQDFYIALQYNFTKYQKYDGVLSYNITSDTDTYISYQTDYNGNFPTNKHTYIEMYSKNGVIKWVHAEKNFTDLVGNFDGETGMTVFENLLLTDIDKTIDGQSDGYYYGLIEVVNSASSVFVANAKTVSVKVHSAYYSPDRIPVVSGSDYYTKNLQYVDDNKLANGQILGACSDRRFMGYYLGTPSSYVMCLKSDLSDVVVDSLYNQ